MLMSANSSPIFEKGDFFWVNPYITNNNNENNSNNKTNKFIFVKKKLLKLLSICTHVWYMAWVLSLYKSLYGRFLTFSNVSAIVNEKINPEIMSPHNEMN